MKMRNEITGDVLEMPPPNSIGEAVVLLNGRIIERVLYSDATNSVTVGDGRMFAAGQEFAKYLVSVLANPPGAEREPTA